MGKVNTNFERIGSYGRMLRVRNNRVTRAPSIGFEYEIPLNSHGALDMEEDIYYDDWELSEFFYDYLMDSASSEWNRFESGRARGFSTRVLENLGYRHHTECGGFEIASPVFPTIATARSHAKHIVQLVKSKPELFYERNTEGMNDCGIHVHVALPGADDSGWRINSSSNRREDIYNMMLSMCNRTSSREFIWQLSGRADMGSEDSHYITQGMADEWDTYGAWRYSDYHPTEMMRLNNPTGCGSTIENRMFAAATDRLVPAIEFTHSLMKFCVWMIKAHRSESGVPEYPYLAQWKEWLDREPGYRTLKSYAPFDLIGG